MRKKHKPNKNSNTILKKINEKYKKKQSASMLLRIDDVVSGIRNKDDE